MSRPSPRQIVIGSCLIAFAAAGTVPALAGDIAGDLAKKPRNEVCLVLAQDDNGDTTKDFCVNWPGAQR